MAENVVKVFDREQDPGTQWDLLEKEFGPGNAGWMLAPDPNPLVKWLQEEAAAEADKASYDADYQAETRRLADMGHEGAQEALWDAGEGVCCAAFQLGACVHTESYEQEGE